MANIIESARNFIRNTSYKYRILNNGGVNVNIKCDEHVFDRYTSGEDLNIKDKFQYMVTLLIKYNIAELIYLIETTPSCRINLYSEDGYMIGVHGSKYRNGDYSINLRTMYKERNHKNRKRVIDFVKIDLKTKDFIDKSHPIG